MRSSAKNHRGVVIVTDPSQYSELIEEVLKHNGSTTIELRRKFAAAAFSLSAKYEAAVARRFALEVEKDALVAAGAKQEEKPLALATRTYKPELVLKYGCNPHQNPAALCSIVESGSRLPLKVLNGKPGYINLLDAANSWQLVNELRQTLGLAAGIVVAVRSETRLTNIQYSCEFQARFPRRGCGGGAVDQGRSNCLRNDV